MKPLGFEHRILLYSLAAGFPGTVLGLWLLWTGDFTPKVQWTFSVFVVCTWLGFAFSTRSRAVFPLQTLVNVLAGLREGDYSIRARGYGRDDVLQELSSETSALSATLREQRLGAVEATALLRKVMQEINVAVFTFDGDRRLRLVNRAGERILAQPQERLLGRTAEELGLAELLRADIPHTVQMNFPGASGRWEIRQGTFRQGGLPHQLLVMADLSRPLREEERQAWQRLIRVIGHELNNSLAPIKSFAESLGSMLSREPKPDDWQEDMKSGLSIIGARAASLSRFTTAYAKLAKLPVPNAQPLEVGPWLTRVASLESRMKVEVVPGPTMTIQADGDQLEQVIINLMKNAVDASRETGGGVRVMWTKNATFLDLIVQDDGPGLPNTTNLFVPFFTTKQDGSGIGLVLSRQIAEAHGGALMLQNRTDGARGCEAHLRLPL
ncbi:MAG: PAS domain-containing protein [Acidobacteria bacterium]|nr:PAS domain-containing protein [Acidobacteriota bacterium]